MENKKDVIVSKTEMFRNDTFKITFREKLNEKQNLYTTFTIQKEKIAGLLEVLLDNEL